MHLICRHVRGGKEGGGWRNGGVEEEEGEETKVEINVSKQTRAFGVGVGGGEEGGGAESAQYKEHLKWPI